MLIGAAVAAIVGGIDWLVDDVRGVYDIREDSGVNVTTFDSITPL